MPPSIREIMSKRVVFVSPEDSVSFASKLMAENKIGSVVVLDGDKPAGIVTERDVLEKVVAGDRSPGSVKVREIMSAPVVTISPNADLESAVMLMAQKRIKRLVVLEQNRLAGIVTATDLIARMGEKVRRELLELYRKVVY